MSYCVCKFKVKQTIIEGNTNATYIYYLQTKTSYCTAAVFCLYCVMNYDYELWFVLILIGNNDENFNNMTNQIASWDRSGYKVVGIIWQFSGKMFSSYSLNSG